MLEFIPELCHTSGTPRKGAADLSATRIPPGPEYTGGGCICLTIYLSVCLSVCLSIYQEFIGRPNQSCLSFF